MNDPVNHPKHYTSHPSGVECITVTECMNFNLGNAVKYIWRNGDKGDHIQDLKKARWYIDREIQRLEVKKQALLRVRGGAKTTKTSDMPKMSRHRDGRLAKKKETK